MAVPRPLVSDSSAAAGSSSTTEAATLSSSASVLDSTAILYSTAGATIVGTPATCS
jgi:hypothetical protein